MSLITLLAWMGALDDRGVKRKDTTTDQPVLLELTSFSDWREQAKYIRIFPRNLKRRK